MTRYLGLCLIFLLGPFLAACATTNPGELTSPAPLPDTAAPLDQTLPDAEDVAEPTPDPSTDLTLTSCGGHLVQDLVGTTLAAAQSQGRIPEDARIIRPGDVVAQSYSPQRMNVFLTATTVIDQINCG